MFPGRGRFMRVSNLGLLGGVVILCVAPWASAQNWTGSVRCELSSTATGYSHRETQTWTLNGAAPTRQGAFNVYPATWSVTGQGTHDRTREPNRRAAQWTANVQGVSAPVSLHVTPSGQLIAQLWHSQLSSPGGYTGTDQYFNSGVPQPQARLVATVYEWQPQKVEASPRDTRITRTSTIEVKGQLGPMQPPEAQSSVSCSWALGLGAAPALPASTQPAQPESTTPGVAPPVAATPPSTATPPATSAPVATPPPTTPPATTPPAATPPVSSTPPANGVRLVGATPRTVEQGAFDTVMTLTASGTHWTQARPVVTVEPGFGYAVSDAVVISDTELMVPLAIQFSAAPGPRTISVTAGTEVLALANAFTITARARPELVSVTPLRARQGDRNLTIQMTGRNTRWAQGATRVRIAMAVNGNQPAPETPPPGVNVLSTTVHSATSATAVIDVEPDAVPGAYWFSVFDTAPPDWLKIIDGFVVEPGAGGTAPPGAGTAPGGNSSPGTAPGAGVSAPSVHVDNPNGGQTWTAGSHDRFLIYWTHTYPEGQLFNVDISFNGGRTWQRYDSNRLRDSEVMTYAHPEFQLTEAALVRVSPAGGGGEGDVSDAPFTIAAPTPANDPAAVQRYLAHDANMTGGQPITETIDVVPTNPLSDQWWQVDALDNPTSTNPMMQFRAEITGGAADRRYDLDILAQTRSGWINSGFSGTSNAPKSGLTWSNLPGVDDRKTFNIRVRHSAGAPTTQPFRLTLSWGGSPPSALTSLVAVPISPAILPVQFSAVRIISPNGGENWAAGQEHYVGWKHSLGDQQLFDVEVSVDGGSTWVAAWQGAKAYPLASLGEGVVGTVVFLPKAVSSTALLRVKAAGQAQPSDVSDAAFSLVPPAIVMTQPAAGARWLIGANTPAPGAAVTLAHNLWPQVSFVCDLSRDGGATWTNIGPLWTGNSFVWNTVTGPATTRARIRVRPVHGGRGGAGESPFTYVEAQSPNFTIAAP
jgi:hypothetical protein